MLRVRNILDFKALPYAQLRNSYEYYKIQLICQVSYVTLFEGSNNIEGETRFSGIYCFYEEGAAADKCRRFIVSPVFYLLPAAWLAHTKKHFGSTGPKMYKCKVFGPQGIWSQN